MKSVGLASISALFLLSLTTPWPALAQTPGPSAYGTYQFLLEDELAKYVELDARTDERGTTTGQMTFFDPARIPDVDDAEDPRAGDAPPEFYIRAELDGLTIEKNRALMSGTVLDSSHRTYIGRWVQLVVEDNGGNQEIPDRLTWAFCRPRAGGWIPSDAERDFDDGAYLRWWATDAEREDDVGIPSPDLISNEERSCRIYSLALYTFADVLRGEGDIVVQP
jgi:hypothetical protein